MEIRQQQISFNTILGNHLRAIGILALKTLIKGIIYTFDFLHRILDQIIAHSLYNLVIVFGRGLFFLETWLYSYLKKSKYVKDDKFDTKIDEDKLILLGMGLKDTCRITLREISCELGVSEYYARRIKEIAKNWFEYFGAYQDIMKRYRSDSEKKDQRSDVRGGYVTYEDIT